MGLTPEESAQRQAVIDEARTWIGTPYEFNGRTKGVGVDCHQLVIAVYLAAGVPMPSSVPLHTSWTEAIQAHRDEMGGAAYLAEFMHEVEVPGPGDMALFEFWRTYIHTAIVIQWPTEVLHALRVVSISDVRTGTFSKRRAKFLSPKIWS